MLEKLLSLDTKLFLWLNGHHSLFWDKVMWFISGKVEWLPLYLLIVGVIIYQYRWKSIYIFIAVALFVTLADQISTNIFKDGFKRLRPSHAEELKGLVHIVNNYYGGQYGFVSSHAANTFAMASFLAFLFHKKWFTILILSWALIVSYSRIYLGVHYPGDILGGAILGALIGYGVYLLYSFLVNKFIEKKA
jgi:undecaprenyl-diphosphatase